MKEISIVYITDNRYAMPTCISILSLKSSMSKNCIVKVYVICDMVEDNFSKAFLNLADEQFFINIINVADARYYELAKLCQSFAATHVSASALFKLNICEILKEENKIIYLDGDTLIQNDLGNLFEINIDEDYVAAVDDQFDIKVNGNSYLASQIGICTEHYFNSGVMLLNLKKMREDGISEKLIDFRKYNKNIFMDQDALNAILGDKRKVLPYKYNFMSTCVDFYDVHEISERFFGVYQESIDECISNAVILHLTGKYKPWEYNMPWFSSLFMKYYEKSPYSKEKINMKSISKALRDEQVISLKYIFPYDKIAKNEKIILYGAGKIGEMYYKQIVATKYCEIVGWVDSNYKNKGDLVQSPEIIDSLQFSKIVISIASSSSAESIKELLIKRYCIDTKKIILV